VIIELPILWVRIVFVPMNYCLGQKTDVSSAHKSSPAHPADNIIKSFFKKKIDFGRKRLRQNGNDVRIVDIEAVTTLGWLRVVVI
jgi:hypothetical protein